MGLDCDSLANYLQFLIIIFCLYLAFFKSYFQEKGKNLATQEDIEEITSKIEIIRHDLHLKTESELSLRAEERNAVVDYYVKYHNWLNTILQADLLEVDEQEDIRFKEIELRLKKAKFDFEIAQAKFEIFVEDPEIGDLEERIIMGTLTMQHMVQQVMSELKHVNFDISVMKKTTAFRSLRTQDEKHSKLLEEKSEVLNRFRKQQVNKYKELLVDKKELKVFLYKRIKSLF